MYHWKHGTDVIFIYRLGNYNIQLVTHTLADLHSNLADLSPVQSS